MNDKKIYYSFIVNVSYFFFALFYTAAQLLDKFYEGTTSTLVMIYILAITAFSMPLLYSGMCGRFMDNGTRLSSSFVYRKILPPTVIATVLWCFIGTLIYWKQNFNGDYRLFTLNDSFSSVLRAPSCLFFYPMILLVVILYPFLKSLMEDRKYMRYMSLIAIAVCLLGSLVAYVSFFPDELGMMMAFISYIFLAVFVEQTEFRPAIRIIIYLAGLLATGLMIHMTIRYSVVQSAIDYTWVEEATIFVIIQLFAVLVLIRELSRRIKTKAKISYWIREFSSYAYIYILIFALVTVPLDSAAEVRNLAVPARFMLDCFGGIVVTLILCSALTRLPVISLYTGGFRDIENLGTFTRHRHYKKIKKEFERLEDSSSETA